MAEHQGSQEADRVGPDPGVPPLAQVLANSWRGRILRELTLRPMSIKGFVEEVGGSQSAIHRHFAQLLDWGFIEVVETKRGGRRYGAIERLYRALRSEDLDAEAWAALTQEERETKSENVIASYFQRVLEAVEAKTFDADLARHWTWDALELDEIALRQLGARLEEVQALARELAAESEERARRSGEETISVTLGLGAFRTPREPSSKRPRPTPEGRDRLARRD